MSTLGKIIRNSLTAIFPSLEYKVIDGSTIPAPDRRWCGPEFKDDKYYLKSAEAEARRLIEHFHLNEKSRVLDVGCGQGRLPIGLSRLVKNIDYTGIDLDKWSVGWCKRYIEKKYPYLKFKHLNLYNERYNKTGIKIDDNFMFEVADNSIDIIYLYSVFSHTTEQDMLVYLHEFSRILDKDGKIFFTTFVEKNVPDYSANPDEYWKSYSGPLHVVRYDKDYLFAVLEECGFIVKEFDHGVETSGQSAIYLGRK